MKRVNLSLFFIFLFTYCVTVAPVKAQGNAMKQDTLSQYTGKYQMQQGMQTVYADVYLEQGKLMAKAATGELLVLDHVNGDNFIIASQHVPVKFLRDKDNKVSQVSVNGSTAWTRAGSQLTPGTPGPASFNPEHYLGKYQLTAGGQVLKIEISLKNGQLWATQLWDGGSSGLDFVSTDNFIVNALSVPIKFIRDKDNQVVQLLFHNHDLFTKVKN
ncbi:MAG TPA: DUF3471 domain-containing protein [Mucilaginibacter sp.]